MKPSVFTYIVVLQSSDSERVTLVYTGTFDQVLKKARLACPKNYFIRSISVA